MDNEGKLHLLRWRIKRVESDIDAEALPTLPKILGLTSYPLLMGSRSRSAEDNRLLPLDEVCSYLAILPTSVLEE